jgi:hypothetical protein
MSKRPCAKTMHQIALMAQETADVWREGLLECGSIYERIRIQGGIDALDDFADSLWLKRLRT